MLLNINSLYLPPSRPLRTRYNLSMSMNKNVNLSKHTLLRFNIFCVMKDTADPTKD